MTRPRVVSDLFMLDPSFNLCPTAPINREIKFLKYLNILASDLVWQKQLYSFKVKNSYYEGRKF